MRPVLLVPHVLAGSVALVAGFVALFAAKGATTHRRAGMVFVLSMLAMALLGATLSALAGGEGSVIAGVMTAYLVVTALATVRTPAGWSRRLDVGLMLLAGFVALGSLALGVLAATSLTGRRPDGLPPFPFFMFGTVGLLAALGDARMLRAGPPAGTARLVRHLWRMCWALWIAASSFFWGQAKVIPEPLRNMALLSIPPLTVLVALLYWLWRVRFRQSPRRRSVDVGAVKTA